MFVKYVGGGGGGSILGFFLTCMTMDGRLSWATDDETRCRSYQSFAL